MQKKQTVTYKDAGVDVDKGDAFVERIRERVQSTYNNRVVSGVGGFASLYKMAGGKLLATGTDGVGTKVKIAQLLNRHDTIGIDLVAMCVNDILCTGAKPLFFLDYIATGKLELHVAEEIVKGIVEGCKQSEAALIGGETAEMPGLYQTGEYDLAGFAVGEVDEKDVLTGDKIKDGDTLIALASSGLHSNGFSLVRKLVKENEKKLLTECLTPTLIYWNAVKNIFPFINGMAHITGGSFANIPRINKKFDYVVETLPKPDEIPSVLDEMTGRSGLSGTELYTTFNMGVGLVLATSDADKVTAHLTSIDQKFWEIGHTVKGQGKVNVRSGKNCFVIQ